MRVAVRSAQRSLRSLEAAGHIHTELNAAPDIRIHKSRRPNAYRIIRRGDTVGTPPAVPSSAPWGDTSGPSGVTPVGTQTVIEPSVEPSVKPSRPDGRIAESFKTFWDLYPLRNGRKVGKKAALDKWKVLKANQQEVALAAVQAYAEAVARTETIPRDAERFLKNDYWKDWLPVCKLETPKRAKCEVCDGRGWTLPDNANEVVACSACRDSVRVA